MKMTMKAIAVATVALCTAQVSEAAVVTLDFKGVAKPSNQTTVGDYYNGGTSGDGNSGTNYGVAFSDNALALNSYNGANEPDPGILFFLSGGAVTINYAAGFDTGFSFFYASNTDAFIRVYDGLNGTGNVLASLSLINNFQSGCGYCQWDTKGVSFSGIARSIDFGGGANYVAYDDITFGSATPGSPTPEPATWALMITGFGFIGNALRRRRLVTAA